MKFGMNYRNFHKALTCVTFKSGENIESMASQAMHTKERMLILILVLLVISLRRGACWVQEEK